MEGWCSVVETLPRLSEDKALPGFLSSCLNVEGMTAGTTPCTGWWLRCAALTVLQSHPPGTKGTESLAWTVHSFQTDPKNKQPSFKHKIPPQKIFRPHMVSENKALWSYLVSWFVRPPAHFRSLTFKKQKLNACLSSPQILVSQPGTLVSLKMEMVLLIFFLLF